MWMYKANSKEEIIMKTLMRTIRQLAMVSAAVVLSMGGGVANATIVDLTVSGNSGYIGDAYFTTNNEQPTGTGYINPFLRIQATGIEQGYNTDGATNTAPWDDKTGIWTHSLLLQDLVSSDGYYKFLLDINQTAANPQLDLIDVKLFLGGNGTSALNNFSQLGTQIYGFDAGDVVHTNYLLNPGSGGGDIFMFIPTSLFAGHLGSEFFTLYSKFDLANDGFEEWAVNTVNSPPVPEPGTMMLLGIGMLGLAVFGKRRMNKES